jgi:excisionase family DNA binding protein
MSEDLVPPRQLPGSGDDARAQLFDLFLDELAERVAKRLRPLVSGNDAPSGAEHPLMLDVDAAAARLGITPDALRKKVHRGQIPSVKDGARLRFRPVDLEQYVDSRVKGSIKQEQPPQAIGGMSRFVR